MIILKKQRNQSRSSLKDNIENGEDLVAKNVHIGSYKYDEKNIIIISCKPLNKDIYAEDKNGKVYIRSASSCSRN